MFTFESLVTPEGMAAVGVVVMSLIQLLKLVWPKVFDFVNGLQQAFLYTLAVYVIGAMVLSPLDANGYLRLFLAWLLAASAAVASYEAAGKQITASLTKTQPRKVIGPNEKFDEP